MAFNISQIDHNGIRLKSILVNEKNANISADADATLQVNFPDAVSINIEQDKKVLLLSITGSPVIFKEKEHSATLKIRNSADFSCCGQQFHITCQIGQNLIPRKKSYVSAFALFMVWTLLVIMLITPIVLPYKIKAHVQGNRNALIDKCAKSLDSLRKQLRKKKSATHTPIQRDILFNINEEIEQIIWTFRNAGEFMNQQQMVTLEEDIHRYFEIVKLLDETTAIKVQPLDTNKVINALILKK